MRKKYLALTVILLLLTSLVITVGANDDSALEQAGKYIRDFWDSEKQRAHSDDQLVAEYHGQDITKSYLEFQRNTRMLLLDAPSDGYSDQELIHIIVEGMMMVEEAQRLGLTATQEEIDAMVQGQKSIYNYPEVKEPLDDYCNNAGITIDEYYELLEDIAPSYIAKQKLRDEIGRQYCQEHGLEFTKINPPQEMIDAIDDYIEELFQTRKDEIVYYIDIGD